MKRWLRKVLELRYLSSSQGREFIRLKKHPRYVPTESEFLGNKVKMVDACTFLYGVEEIFEKDIYHFKASTNQPYIIDCGANIGLSVIYFKTLFPNAIIKAFEPDPLIFETLKCNIDSFNLQNVEAHQQAIWKENTAIQFKQEGGFSGRIPKKEDTNQLIEVDAVSLKDILGEIKVVDFLKIDIEGAEYEVIKSCQNSLNNVRHIFIEYHSHENERQTLQEILQILQDSGFRYHLQEAFVRQKPYINKETMLGMDLQLNIFGYRK